MHIVNINILVNKQVTLYLTFIIPDSPTNIKPRIIIMSLV